MSAAYPVRLALFCLHIVAGLFTCTLVFPFCSQAARLRHIQRWSARLLRICGVAIELAALPAAAAGTLIVANHISWLDIFVLNACQPCRFIAKSEVRRWPVLGYLAMRAGTVFIERGNRRALGPLLLRVAGHIDGGSQIAYFPEGTSAPQGAMLPFHSALFEAARGAAIAVQPVALAYFNGEGEAHRGAEYVGATTFAQSVRLILSGPSMVARVAYLAPIAPHGLRRRELAAAAEQAVTAALARLGPS